jgi:hypothetical protein
MGFKYAYIRTTEGGQKKCNRTPVDGNGVVIGETTEVDCPPGYPPSVSVNSQGRPVVQFPGKRPVIAKSVKMGSDGFVEEIVTDEKLPCESCAQKNLLTGIAVIVVAFWVWKKWM